MFLSIKLPEGKGNLHTEVVQQILVLAETVDHYLERDEPELIIDILSSLYAGLIKTVISSKLPDFLLVDDLTKSFERSGLYQTTDLQTFSHLLLDVLKQYNAPVFERVAYDCPDYLADDGCIHDEPEEPSELYNGM